MTSMSNSLQVFLIIACHHNYFSDQDQPLFSYKLKSQFKQNKKTRLREKRSLRHACKEFGLAGGMILTEDVEKIVETDGLTIRYYPLWKWLLGI